MSSAQLLTQFLDDIAYRRSGSSHTQVNYRRAIETFLAWVSTDDPAQLAHYSAYELQHYFTSRAKSDLAPRSVINERAAISSFYRFLIRRGVVQHNPVKPTKVKKPDKTLPKSLPMAPLNQTLDTIQATLSARDRWILEGLYGTGLRVSEFAGIRFSDIRPDEHRIEVIGKGSKLRSVPLTERAWATLLEYLLERGASPQALGVSNEPVLVGEHNRQLSVRTIQRVVSQLLGGLRSGASVTPHQLRHSYASHLLADGADLRAVQELLGHARLGTTQIYTHLDAGRLQELVRKNLPRSQSEPLEEK